MPKPLTVWITINCGKFLKRWEYQTTLPASWEICMQVKKQQLEPNIEQQTNSKLGKEYCKAVYCHPAYLTYMQSTSCKMPGCMKHELESRLPGEISVTSDMLAWKIPWMEEPGRLQSMESLRVRHDWATSHSFSLSCNGEGYGNPNFR